MSDNEATETKADESAEILAQFKQDYRDSAEHFKEWRTEAIDLYAFDAGKQWTDEDEAIMQEKRRPMVTFNLFSKFIDAVCGLQINNRQEIRFYPRENGDVGQSDIGNAVVKWNRDLSDADQEETDAFRDLILVGMGYIEHRLEDSTDPEGYIAQERRDPLEMFPDPRARKRNLVDGRFIIRIVPMSAEDYEDRFGEEYAESEESDEFQDDGEEQNPRVIHEPQDYDGKSSDGAKVSGKVRVAHYQYWRLETCYQVKALLPDGEQSQTFEADEWPPVEARLKAIGIVHQVNKIKLRRYRQAYICGGKVHEHKLMPSQSGFTYKVLTGKRDRNKATWFGIGRNAKDPNLWVNKFFSSILWQLSVNPKGGLLAEAGAFDDPAKAEATWADPSAITVLAEGAISEGRVKEKPNSSYPQGMDRLMEFSVNALPGTTGLNLEIMGMADRVQAGVVEAQRKQSAMAIIAWAFDAMRRYYRESGRLMLEWSRDYLADGRLIRITGEAGAQYVPLFRDKLTGTFDIVVDEAPSSTNMRERTWMILREIIPMAQQAGIPIPKELLDYAPIPDELAQKWKKAMQPDPQKQAEDKAKADAMLEAQVREILAKVKRDESQALLNEAKAGEIVDRAPYETMKTAAQAGAAQAGISTAEK